MRTFANLIICVLFAFEIEGQSSFCDAIRNEDFSSVEIQVDSFLKVNNLDSLRKNNVEVKFQEIELLRNYLKGSICVDSCNYDHAIMKTNPPMVDVRLFPSRSNTDNFYTLRLRFENYTKTVFFRKLEN